MLIAQYILVGIVSGAVAGALGIGGGIIMVPAMILFFGLTQHQAQGTTLAVMLPPILFFAVMRYYMEGNVKVQMAVFVALGFTLGAYFGANAIQGLPDAVLKKAFGVLLIAMGAKMIFLR